MKNKYSLRNALSKTLRSGLFVGLSLLSIGLTNNLLAQVSSYAFSQSAGTYSEITGGTVLASCNACGTSFDTQLYTVALPTPFLYNGTSITNVRMGVDGMLLLGTTTGTSTTTGISSTQVLPGIISGLNMDMRNTTIAGFTWELRFEEAGDLYIFQWKNASRWSQDAVERFSFQIQLDKVSGSISFVYGDMNSIAASTTYIPQVGLRGATNADYNSRRLTTTVPTATPTWNNTTASTVNSHNVRFTSVAPAAFPSSGLTFTWTPPVPCTGTPEAGNIVNLIQYICPGSTPSAITTSGASIGVSNLEYQWQQSADNGVLDPWVNAVGGTNATTPAYTPPSFLGQPIYYRLRVTCAPSTEVDFSNGQLITSPLTPTEAPTALVFSNVNGHSMNIAFTSGNGNRRFVVINTSDNFTTPTDGSGAALVASNLYTSGEQIVYDGTGSSVLVNGLSCNTTYFVRVYEYQRCGASAPYSYLYLNSPLAGSQLISVPIATLPVMNDFTGFTGANLGTVQPGFYEANIPTTSGTTPAQTGLLGNTSIWASSTVFTGNTTAKVNLYLATRNEWIITPKVAITVPTTLSYKVAITNFASSAADPEGMQGTDDKVKVMVSTDCGATWTPLRTFDASNTATISNSLVTFSENLDAYIGQTIQIAFQATDGPVDELPDYDFHIDDINIYETPACVTPIGLTASAASLTSASISWTAVTPAPATGYEYVVSVSNTAPVVAGTSTTNITETVSGLLPNTTYYVFVRSNCGAGSFSAWSSSATFTTSYCTPAPTTVDGQGITNVTYGTINNTTVAEAGNYGDYSALTTDVVIGAIDTLKIQYSTGYTYDTKVWIDFNNDLDFNDPGEEVFSGVSLATNPTVLNAPIFIPVGSPQGQHRMRIGGQDVGPVTACYTGSWASFEDYTVNVICPTTIPAPTLPVGDIICANASTEVSGTGINGASFNWFASATGGTSLGTNDTLVTGVLTTTTSFYLEQSFAGCVGVSPRLEVTAIVTPVNLSLTAIDNTCNGYSAGSFALGTVQCGTAPFTYSVNGGAFGPIPTNLAAGTYSIIAKDANNDDSEPISVTIGQPATVIATPTVTNAVACVGATSEMISAVGIPITQTTPVVVSFDITAQPVEVNAAPGNVIATATMPTLPAGAVITGATLNVPGITALGSSWQADVRLGLSGALVNAAAAGAGTPNLAGNFNYTRTFTPTAGTGSTINILYWDNFNDVNPGDDATFTTGVGAATLSLTYTLPSDVTWWTAATGGTQIGTTASIEAIGTPVMASPAAAGTYTFYAQTETGTCSSVTRAPLTVTVTPNPAPAITASNPILCDGSSILLVSSIENGNVWSSSATATNDTLSVSTAGSFTVTVTDANGCVGTSAPYVTTITALPVISAGIDQTVCANSNVTLVGTGAPTLTWNNGITNNTPFVATATNSYIVTGTAANGCVNTDTVTVNVNALPVPVITGDLAICAGDSTLLVASSETGNVWSTTATNDSIYVSTAGSITVTETDANGCIGTSSPAVVVVNALPAVNAGSDYAVCENTTTILSGSGAVSYTWDNNISNNIGFLVTETKDYIVTGTDVNGCVNTDTITVTANALPTVNGGNNIEQCGDQSVTLTATGATAYAWSGGVENGTAFNAPFGTSVYIVTGVDAFGCSNTDAVTVSIFANPTATITPINGVTLQANPAGASYQWINCANNQPIAGAVTPVFTATENGSYAVIVTGMGGCDDTSACFNVTTVGIEKTELDASINLFPNPTTSNVTLAMSSDKAVNVTVFDAQGKVVSIIDNAQNGSIIGLQHVENGVYMVQVSNETGSKVFRVVKQ